MRQVALAVLAVLIFPLATSSKILAADYAGFVKSLEGQASVISAGETSEAVVGMDIKAGDIIKTGANGSVGLIFKDDTIITMGPQTELAIEEYLFDPVDEKLGFIARIVRGTLSYLSGQIAKIAPQSVQLKTPAATIGVRGTHVLIKVE